MFFFFFLTLPCAHATAEACCGKYLVLESPVVGRGSKGSGVKVQGKEVAACCTSPPASLVELALLKAQLCTNATFLSFLSCVNEYE